MTQTRLSPTGAPPISRRTLFRAAGLGTAAAAVTTAAPARAAGGVTGLDPTDIGFDVVKQFRPRDLVGDGFVTLDDRPGVQAPAYDVLGVGGRAGTIARRNGRLVGSGSRRLTLLRSHTGQVAPFASVVMEPAAYRKNAS